MSSRKPSNENPAKQMSESKLTQTHSKSSDTLPLSISIKNADNSLSSKTPKAKKLSNSNSGDGKSAGKEAEVSRLVRV